MSLRELPKVELHCHLDGALRPATILELARERGVKLPADTAEGLTPHVQVRRTCTLTECLAVFELVYPLLRDARALERAAYELLEDSARDNIRYVEVRFAPSLNAAPGFSTDDALDAVVRGLDRGRVDFGVSSGVIVCLLRGHEPKRNRAAFETLKRGLLRRGAFGHPGAVGLDLAGDESRHPIGDYADFFLEARQLGIPATCHAGEVSVAEITAALELGVRRLGHATRLADDLTVQGAVARAGVAVEVNLTSNVRTGSVPSLERHPARRLFDARIPISFNTDDRGLFGIDLTHEYEAALHAGFSETEVARVALAAVDQLFLSDGDREVLRRQLAPAEAAT